MPDRLPVHDALAPLAEALNERGCAVLAAPPGAGKTTVVPLHLLGEKWLAGRRIVMVEPRRLAARAAARRMAQSLSQSVGEVVGFRTRLEREVSESTRIEVVTEGILTRRLVTDPMLEGVGVIIFDEVHERNLHTDLAMALALASRRILGVDVALLAMSATADTEAVARLLGGDSPAPVIASAGRQYPVEIRHVPRGRNEPLEAAVSGTVRTALRDTDGDILVFLPGIAEINRARAALESPALAGVDLHRLAGAVEITEQDAALAASPPGRRRVVLATDIAETSLTVEGISVVVDAGLARVPRFDPRTQMTSLHTVTSSRSSAEQRAGRAGRLGPGVAYKMWSRIEDSTRPGHLPPEITQVDACSAVLDIAAYGARISDLDLLDQPPERLVRDAMRTLGLLCMVDGAGAITALGRRASSIPVHPRLAAMVLGAGDPGRSWLACVLAAIVEERDVLRGRPSELPADIALRVELVCGVAVHDRADRGAVHRVREAARDIARRLGIARSDPSSEDVHRECGALLLAAYPDRLAVRSAGGSAGQFTLGDGRRAWVDRNDPLAREDFIVCIDIDGDKASVRVRRGAAITIGEVHEVLGDVVTTEETLAWDKQRNDLRLHIVTSLGKMRLDERTVPARPGPGTERAILERVVATRLGVLAWDDAAVSLRRRIGAARIHCRDEEWPDVSDAALVAGLDNWLAPHLAGCTSREDLERIDISMVLSAMLGWDRAATLGERLPAAFASARGRPVPIDYSDPERPVAAVRVQDMYGVDVHPCVLGGRLPITLELLSPAGRPIQVTADLPGFWRGSWAEVRREMAGRYPKHDWPVDPAAPR